MLARQASKARNVELPSGENSERSEHLQIYVYRFISNEIIVNAAQTAEHDASLWEGAVWHGSTFNGLWRRHSPIDFTTFDFLGQNPNGAREKLPNFWLCLGLAIFYTRPSLLTLFQRWALLCCNFFKSHQSAPNILWQNAHKSRWFGLFSNPLQHFKMRFKRERRQRE